MLWLLARPELTFVIERLLSMALLSFVDYRCAAVDGHQQSSVTGGFREVDRRMAVSTRVSRPLRPTLVDLCPLAFADRAVARHSHRRPSGRLRSQCGKRTLYDPPHDNCKTVLCR
jgi:hypothetical protein